MTEEFNRPTADEIEAFSDEIAALLHGKGPMLQGAALADIVARFFAGHNPNVREESLEIWIDHMRQLIRPNEQQLKARYGANLWNGKTN